MIRLAPRSTATSSTSASTRRPSASVLWTSIVLPLRAVSTSPSFMAAAPGMFSTRPIRPMTLTGSLSRAMACIAPSTVAAPAMSHFIVIMPSVGLMRQAAGIERHALAHQGQQRVVARRRRDTAGSPAAAGRLEPLATASSDPQPSASSRCWSQISRSRPHCRGHVRGLLGERLRIDLLRRLVHQPPREVHALAQHAAVLPWPPDRRRTTAARRTDAASSRRDTGPVPGSRPSRRTRRLPTARRSSLRPGTWPRAAAPCRPSVVPLRQQAR